MKKDQNYDSEIINQEDYSSLRRGQLRMKKIDRWKRGYRLIKKRKSANFAANFLPLFLFFFRWTATTSECSNNFEQETLIEPL